MARSMLLAWTIATFKPYRSEHEATRADQPAGNPQAPGPEPGGILDQDRRNTKRRLALRRSRSEEHTSELQSQSNLVCRLLLEKKKKKYNTHQYDTGYKVIIHE